MSRWPTRRLGDLVELLSGFPFESEHFANSDGIPIVRIRDVVLGKSSTFYRGAFDSKYIVRLNDILIGMDGEFNRARWQSGDALLNQRVCRITSSSRELDDGYLFHFLPAALKAIERVTPFVTVKHLSTKQIKDIEIRLPPLAEQKRVAAILDKVEVLRAKRHAALNQVNALTQSIFFEMFGDLAANHKAISTACLGDLCTRITDGTHQPPVWSPSGVPFLFVGNIVGGEIRFETEKFISETTHAELTRRCPIEIGDVLYSTVGSYGVSALVKTAQKFAFQRHIAHLKPNQAALDSEFLRVMLASPSVRRQADKVARGVAQKTVNLADIRNFIIFSPSLESQRDFSLRSAAVEKVKAANLSAQTELAHLMGSVQYLAFQGEL